MAEPILTRPGDVQLGEKKGILIPRIRRGTCKSWN